MKQLIYNIQKSLHQSFIKTPYKFTQRSISDLSINNFKSVGILFDAATPENVWKVIDFKNVLTQKGIEVTLLGYINDEQPGDVPDLFAEIDFITKKDLNWLLTPVSYKSKDFMKVEFDMLLNLYTSECLPLQYISALSNSKYRIGCFNSKNLHCNDLLIKVNREGDLEHFIFQLEKILN